MINIMVLDSLYDQGAKPRLGPYVTCFPPAPLLGITTMDAVAILTSCTATFQRPSKGFGNLSNIGQLG